jgi:hypothetical protein
VGQAVAESKGGKVQGESVETKFKKVAEQVLILKVNDF